MTSAHRPNAVVIVIDRFGAGYLGPYGNTWLETPTLNRLASESMVWVNAFADDPTVAGFYRAVGSGRHPLAAANPNQAGQLAGCLSSAGVHAALVTDDPMVAELPFAQEFRERICVPPVAVWQAAEAIEESQIAHTLAAALECLDQAPSPFLLWLHLRGMAGTWDAPRQFRESVADEDDPEPPDFLEPPDRQLPPDPDPDEVLGVVQAYAGQVLLLDTCLAPFLQAASTGRCQDNTLQVLTSPRGFPLGEHGALGPHGDQLFEELLHVPLLVRHPQKQNATQRFHGLVQPPDLFPTLLGWFDAGDSGAEVYGRNLMKLASGSIDRQLPGNDRQCLVSALDQHRSIRTPVWFLRQSRDQSPQLYAKPDDRWEVNEVANRRTDVVEQGLGTLAKFEQLVREGRLNELGPLPDVLSQPAE